MYKFSYYYMYDPDDARWHSFDAKDMKQVREHLESLYDSDDGDLSFHISTFDYMLAELLSFDLESLAFEFKHIFYWVGKVY